VTNESVPVLSTAQTEAGRRLVGSLVPVLIPEDRRAFLGMCIRDIEAEAAQGALDDVRAKVEALAFVDAAADEYRGSHIDLDDFRRVLSGLQDRGAEREDVTK
jgi:hypothetical protein